MLVVFAGIVGCGLGSFLNVCIFRLPRLCMSIVMPASRCPRCLAQIRWYDNIPLVSFALLGGKCRSCKNPISWRYPLVELMTGLLCFYIGYRHLLYSTPATYLDDITRFTIEVYLIGCMIVVTFIDFEFRIIPDKITILGIILAIFVSILYPSWHEGHLPALGLARPIKGAIAAIFGGIVGAGVIYLTGLFGKLMFRKEAMGWGDVKYMAMLGGFFGWLDVALIFLLSAFLGSLFGLVSWIVTKDKYISYGPYLSLAALVILFLRQDLMDVIRGLLGA